MTRRKQAPAFDLGKVLSRPVQVAVNGETRSMHPFEAEIEQCAAASLKGDMRACRKFLKMCLREGLIAKQEPEECGTMLVRIPKDWDREDFERMYELHGLPPWPGDRDGLTADARARLHAKRRSRRASSEGETR